MKYFSRIIILMLLYIINTSSSCEPDLMISCEDQPEVLNIYPNNNPSGEPVLVRASGIDDELTLRFADEEAIIVDRNHEYISTHVPSGLQGVVELSIETNSICFAVQDFEVTSTYPDFLPPSPPVYIIPPVGFSIPSQVPSDESIYLKNIADETNVIHLFPFREMVTYEADICEEALGDTDYPIYGEQNLSENYLRLVLDREHPINPTTPPLPSDTLVGGFYTLNLEVNGVNRYDNFFVAFSTVTGRQYIYAE